MAHGARTLLGSDCALATTGAAGPDPAPGGTDVGLIDPGTVYVAVAAPSASFVERLELPGDRDHIREATAVAALHALQRALRLPD
jgi:nicotinamide-nucleotide amidase